MTGPRLTEPVRIGASEVPSRVMFGPHETNLGRHRAMSARHAAYYGRRARGGAGVIVTETASVHESDWPYERAPLAARCAEGWAAVADACRPHGARVIAGLGHAGLQGSSAFSQRVLWGPSRVPDPGSREVPMEIERAEIDELVAGFAAAAVRTVGAGLDGVEVNAGQHSLLRQFHSPLTNHRTDGYGEDKLRLTEEVLRALRCAIGPECVLGLRLCCDELAPWAGITPGNGAEQAARFAPLVDYLVVVRGSIFATSATRPDGHTPAGFNVELCREIRAALRDRGHSSAVVLQGSIVDPVQAQDALDGDVAEVVEMTRAQIADPELVDKVRAGRSEHVRPCVLCNQACMVRDHRNPVVSCAVEPASGHEAVDEAPPGTDAAAKRVLVVGGGPAGMEAARMLAERGHEVELAESSAQLGGAALLAGMLPGKHRFIGAVAWWERELDRLGVVVRLGVEVDAASLGRAQSDGIEVVLATGSRPGPRHYERNPGTTVVDAPDALRQLDELPEGPAVVFDPLGDALGVGFSELLAERGRDASIVTQDQVAGTQLARTGDLIEANSRLQRAGVTRELRALLRAVGHDTATLENRWTGQQRTIKCAVLIHCGHRLPDESLYTTGTPRAGDCVAPRTVLEAVLEGRRAALALGSAPVTDQPARIPARTGS
jgi:2,4-dienoyl-CoA reductase (NADPH2)